MDKFNEKEKLFSRESFAAAIQILNRSAISLIDIRHNLISQEESVRSYLLPASAFLFTGGKGEVFLNDTAYSVERFGLFHGGKGTELTIQPRCDWLEYYLVLYKAVEPSFHKSEYIRLLEQVNPFRQQYGFVPKNPIFFSEELRNMFEKWKGATPLNLFYGKAAFYRFIYEVYEELEQGSIHIFEPDVIIMARQYLERYYMEPISINELSSMLGISYSHFHRSFKQQTGKSPQKYLIDTRLTAAMKLLQNSQASIGEIADFCGFQDERNLQRMFSKNIGITPHAYRENMSHYLRDNDLTNLIPFPYNEESQVRLDELKRKGATSMLKQIRSTMVVAAMLSLLLLTACSTTTTNKNDTAPTPTAAATAQETENTEPVEEGTKTIHMDYGDVEIPANPERVVVIFVQGDLLALGVTPVATSFNDDAIFENQAQEITVIDAFSINEEEIMALDPDLILWNTEDEAVYQSLSKIAPTLARDYFSMDYQERLRFFGEVLNRSDKAEELIQDFENKIADTKQQLADNGLSDKSVLCIQNREEGVLSASWFGRGAKLIYDLLDFKVPDKLQEAMSDSKYAKNGSVELSYEVINEYAGDYILVNGSLGELENNEIWKNLPAVKENQLIEAPTNMFWFNDILTMNAQLDLVLDSMLGTAPSN
ncbi:hypothetical protein acsn021_07970 [Anaerocolumna cellulosilytica]|uniref:Uncharacterized protein n=1 Tax=Anaerocolumna cellulosilytica TaxID=433286 RepID=A0A6S6R2G9_9FIRM|nr:AraC family transcriptional regulator [Anaerocolumna cellulosilytica]MBB5197655.1 iron complex transport system substrate-binding protein [Anaerocolumna cellulosilytica]BCJ93228.1 hypothetical protein acsn021_07970 [Anaerocolumna cellulosilytica]